MDASQGSPKIGLIVDQLTGTGGLDFSAARHSDVLKGSASVVPIAFPLSPRESDWIGRVKRIDPAGGSAGAPAYEIWTSDFQIDRVLASFGAGNMDVSQRSALDCLVRVARAEKLDALHVFGAFRNRPLLAAMASIECGIPLILSFRGADIDLRIFGNGLSGLQAAVGVASVCVCVNQGAVRIVEKLFQPPCPVHVIHNHLVPEEFDEPCGSLPELPRPIIGIAAEFRRITGLDFLLDAFAEWASSHAGSLLLIGEFRSDEAHHYSRKIDTMSCSGRIFRIGLVRHREVLCYMRHCDLLVFPSLTDGCPNKVLEAMLSARPLIASRAGGIPELIDDGVEGVLVDPRDGNLHMAIERVLQDPQASLAMAQRARERALSQFTYERARQSWLQAYREAGVCI